MSFFTNIPEDKVLFKRRHFFFIWDSYPVSPGYILIVSNSEKNDFFSLNQEEQAELPKMIRIAKKIIEENFQPDGYNIGMNCGKVAGQTVMHYHCHVIPRYEGDMNDPKGGIRHCIMGKGYYSLTNFDTIK